MKNSKFLEHCNIQQNKRKKEFWQRRRQDRHSIDKWKNNKCVYLLSQGISFERNNEWVDLDLVLLDQGFYDNLSQLLVFRIFICQVYHVIHDSLSITHIQRLGDNSFMKHTSILIIRPIQGYIILFIFKDETNEDTFILFYKK